MSFIATLCVFAWKYINLNVVFVFFPREEYTNANVEWRVDLKSERSINSCTYEERKRNIIQGNKEKSRTVHRSNKNCWAIFLIFFNISASNTYKFDDWGSKDQVFLNFPRKKYLMTIIRSEISLTIYSWTGASSPRERMTITNTLEDFVELKRESTPP